MPDPSRVAARHIAAGGVSLFDLPESDALMEDLRRITKVWASTHEAEAALRRVLGRHSLRENHRSNSPFARGDVEWQVVSLVTQDGERVAQPLNVQYRPGPRPGWIAFQVTL